MTRRKATEEAPTEEQDDQTEKDSREDRQGDGLMEFDDPMFLPEFDDEDGES